MVMNRKEKAALEKAKQEAAFQEKQRLLLMELLGLIGQLETPPEHSYPKPGVRIDTRGVISGWAFHVHIGSSYDCIKVYPVCVTPVTYYRCTLEEYESGNQGCGTKGSPKVFDSKEKALLAAKIELVKQFLGKLGDKPYVS